MGHTSNTLPDGAYTVQVELAGGTGRAAVQSPARLTVKGGRIQAEIQWDSPHYTRMEAGGQVFLPVGGGEGTRFLIPVASLEDSLPVTAETVAMSRPHTIAYTLCFDPGTLRPEGPGAGAWLALAAALLLSGLALAVRIRRMKKHEHKN